MNIKSFLILIFAALLIMSCSSCKSNKEELNKGNLEKTGEQKMEKVSNPQLSPGMVKIKSQTINVKSDGAKRITVQIDDVLGYGHSAPVLNKGDLISLTLSAEQNDTILSKKNDLILIIKSLPSGRDMEDSNIWKLISIE